MPPGTFKQTPLENLRKVLLSMIHFGLEIASIAVASLLLASPVWGGEVGTTDQPTVDHEWLRLFGAALGGGLTVKVLDIIYQEFRRRSEGSQQAKTLVDKHMDPLLKSADELVGKLVSLAREDFKSLHNVNLNTGILDKNDFSSLVFLMSKLWANIEIFRLESISISIVEDARGRKLQEFIASIESRGVRLVDRISQRAVGELMLADRKDGPLNTILFIDFVHMMEENAEARKFLSRLTYILSRTRHTSERQRLLKYGVVIHAMIDTLDPEHQVTRSRPSYPMKLSKKSWRNLKYRIFGQYLTFVPNIGKYLGPPKRGRPQG